VRLYIATNKFEINKESRIDYIYIYIYTSTTTTTTTTTVAIATLLWHVGYRGT
jgi:hypothetical protein